MQSKEESKSDEPINQSMHKALEDPARSHNKAFLEDYRLLIHRAAHRTKKNLNSMSAKDEEIKSLHHEAAKSSQH